MSLLKKRIHYGPGRAASSKFFLLLNVLRANKIINVDKDLVWLIILFGLCVRRSIWINGPVESIYDNHKGEKQTIKMTSQKKKIIRLWNGFSYPFLHLEKETHLSVNRNFFKPEFNFPLKKGFSEIGKNFHLKPGN